MGQKISKSTERKQKHIQITQNNQNSESRSSSTKSQSSSEENKKKSKKAERRGKKGITTKETKNINNIKETNVKVIIKNCLEDDISKKQTNRQFLKNSENINWANGQEISKLDCINNYVKIKVIGKGNFGTVYLVRNNENGNLYAMKNMNKDLIIRNDCVKHILTEKRILKVIQHPFIISLFSSFQTPEKLHLIMEYCNGGELFFHLQSKSFFPEDQARYIAAELYLALSYLHKNKILYRDIKPENIILDSKGDIRLIDFGLAKDRFDNEEKTKTICGTSEYIRNFFIKFSS
jgi:protein-serine/threonine kinase